MFSDDEPTVEGQHSFSRSWSLSLQNWPQDLNSMSSTPAHTCFEHCGAVNCPGGRRTLSAPPAQCIRWQCDYQSFAAIEEGQTASSSALQLPGYMQRMPMVKLTSREICVSMTHLPRSPSPEVRS